MGGDPVDRREGSRYKVEGQHRRGWRRRPEGGRSVLDLVFVEFGALVFRLGESVPGGLLCLLRRLRNWRRGDLDLPRLLLHLYSQHPYGRYLIWPWPYLIVEAL